MYHCHRPSFRTVRSLPYDCLAEYYLRDECSSSKCQEALTYHWLYWWGSCSLDHPESSLQLQDYPGVLFSWSPAADSGERYSTAAVIYLDYPPGTGGSVRLPSGSTWPVTSEAVTRQRQHSGYPPHVRATNRGRFGVESGALPIT